MAQYAVSNVPMKAKTRKKLKAALARRLRELWEEVFAKDLKDPVTRRHAQLNANISKGLSGLDVKLRQAPEPSPDQLQRVLRQIREERFDLWVRSVLMYLVKKFPPFPPGKQPKLTRKQQGQALAEVHKLIVRSELSRKDIYRQVASKYEVHWRTIQNLWTRRSSREKRDRQ